MSHDADDDDGLDSLRGMFRSMPDEDPPERGFAELMAAARIKADELKQPSLWERIVATFQRPQVLALATILILIGGAVFISSRRDKLEAPSPEVAVKQERVDVEGLSNAGSAVAPAPRETEAAQAEDRKALDEPGGGGGKADGASDTIVAPTATPTTEIARPEPKVGAATSTTRPAGKAVSKVTSKQKAPAKMAKPAPDNAGDDAYFGVNRDGETDSTIKGATLGAGTAAVEDTKPPAPTAKQLHTQALAAAGRNDCAAVRTLAKRIAAKDAAYYRANIATDTTLAVCLN